MKESDAVAGSRLLIRYDWFTSFIYEVKILEWSPTRECVKLESANTGNATWYDRKDTDKIIVVEHLLSLTSPP